MCKLWAFVKMDFLTGKPYYTKKNLLIYAGGVLFLAIATANFSYTIGMGIMFVAMQIGHPFVVGEKSNMDALYATLSVDRKTVVLGRYVYALLFTVFAVTGISAVALIGLLTSGIFGSQPVIGSNWFLGLVLLPSLLLVVQAVQLPLFFKYGYSKAKFIAILPLAFVFAGSLAFRAAGEWAAGFLEFFSKTFGSGVAYPAIGAAFMFIVFVSYRLSLMFYKKREF